MTAEGLFSICNLAALAGWVLLVLLPGWKWTTTFITSVLLPGLLGAVYLGLFLANFFGAEGGFGSLGEVRTLFDSDWILLAGWVHYLAFDLFIGSWEVRDARRLGIAHWFTLPCLFLTFFAGPIGLLLWFGVRGAVRRAWRIDVAVPAAE